MVVERERVDAALREPPRDLFLRCEVEGLVAQMEPGICCKAGLERLDRREDPARIVGPTQARFPRPRHPVEHRGDAVRDHLPVALDERDVDRYVDAGPRHHLSLEGVAVDVDDTRQYEQAVGIERHAAGRVRAEPGDDSVGCADVNAGVLELIVEQHLSGNDAKIHFPSQVSIKKRRPRPAARRPRKHRETPRPTAV